MENSLLNNLQALTKALEAGIPSGGAGMVQGAALQPEDLSPKMENLCATNKAIKLQKEAKVTPVKSTNPQFNRRLSYGAFGSSAVWEGAVGPEQTSDFIRCAVPMCYYAHLRRVTMQANEVATFDGQSAEDRQAEDAGLLIASDIEFDIFRGKELYTNGGVMDGNPLAISEMPNMFGLDVQVRQSDAARSSKDIMFQEFGSDASVVISVGSTLTQSYVEDAAVRSEMNHGEADRLFLDPIQLSAYNKLAIDSTVQRFVQGGSPNENAGARLRQQWVSSGTVSLESSRFLSAKTRPAEFRNGPAAPTNATIASTTVSGVVTTFLTTQTYYYYVTACNELGESQKFTSASVTPSNNGDCLDVTITHAAGVRYLNVYRTAAGAAAATAKFIGRVKPASAVATSTVFRDANNRKPGSITGFLVQMDTFDLAELSSYKRVKLAQVDLSVVEAHYRWATLRCFQPRKNVLLDSVG